MHGLPDVVSGRGIADDPGSPLSALINFYRAFNQRDMGLMQDNWLHTPEASMSNPLGGVRRGWAQMQPVYAKIFHGVARVYVEYFDFSIHTEEGMFCTVGRERGHFTTGDTPIALAIRTSRVFRRQDGQWKQLHHHGSMDDPVALETYQTAVLGRRTER